MDTTTEPNEKLCGITSTQEPASLIAKVPILKQLQEDEWHRQWILTNETRYRSELAMRAAAGK